MATTTNFGWTTPDDTDLVKDGAAAIRTLGSSIDTSLVDLKGGTTGQVLAKASGTDMDFNWVADAGFANPMTTTADLIYSSSGSTPARLGIGTDGQVLAVNSGATAPEWVTPAAGGKVLQVVSAVYTTLTTITSATYTDTGLTVSITPSAASSKVLILVAQSLIIDQSANQSNFYTTLFRGATNIFEPQFIGIYAASSTSGTGLNNVVSMAYLDSPSTTSSTTYKTQGKKDGGTQGRYQYGSHASSIIALEIGA